jgi:hypothetical protein
MAGPGSTHFKKEREEGRTGLVGRLSAQPDLTRFGRV